MGMMASAMLSTTCSESRTTSLTTPWKSLPHALAGVGSDRQKLGRASRAGGGGHTGGTGGGAALASSTGLGSCVLLARPLPPRRRRRRRRASSSEFTSRWPSIATISSGATHSVRPSARATWYSCTGPSMGPEGSSTRAVSPATPAGPARRTLTPGRIPAATHPGSLTRCTFSTTRRVLASSSAIPSISLMPFAVSSTSPAFTACSGFILFHSSRTDQGSTPKTVRSFWSKARPNLSRRDCRSRTTSKLSGP
mmetsp:Transcript_38567/g.92675  ORF Transcript_38567/g.92675 Transcript_38567/m.92675 type:complete len:252 (-) Transcript_38567:26-781(-)